jgi:hypothetical protein
MVLEEKLRESCKAEIDHLVDRLTNMKSKVDHADIDMVQGVESLIEGLYDQMIDRLMAMALRKFINLLNDEEQARLKDFVYM